MTGPDNESLGIEPWTGWKLLGAWLGVAAFGWVCLVGVVWLLFKLVELM